MERRGSAVLPLHYGHPPEKLYRRMVRLSGTLSELIIEKFDSETLLKKLSDPFWFHSFSLAIGFDWNSSGTTTATLSALKEYMKKASTSVKVLGGKGKMISAVRTESEDLVRDGFIASNDMDRIRKSSKIVARVDENLLQDSYDLYLHFIVVDSASRWSIIQQGMNSSSRLARRYHWIDSSFSKYLNDGRSGIGAIGLEKEVLNLSTKKSEGNRDSMMDIIQDNPERYRALERDLKQKSLFPDEGQNVLNLDRPVNWQKLREIYEYEPDTFLDLMMHRGVGKSTIRALSYLGEIVFGEKPSFRDPLKFSFALGGKDGIPKPVNYGDYDMCLDFYKEVLSDYKLGRFESAAMAENLYRAGFDIVSRHDGP